MKKRILAGLMTAALAFSMLNVSAFADTTGTEEINVQHTYSNNGWEFEKISHASEGTETADGVVDYLGSGNLEEYVDGVSETGNGDSVQSYCYCSAAYGDWIYIGTMYGALGATSQIKAVATSAGASAEVAEAMVDAMYNGALNKGAEDDGYYAGSIFFKFNIKTGETKILMSREMFENGECDGVPIFRSATEYNGKIYVVGIVSSGTALKSYMGYPLANSTLALNLEIAYQTGVPSIYEVDPETDEVTCCYQCVTVDEYNELNGNMDGKSVFTSTRAIGTYEDYLIAGGIQVDPDGRTDGYAPGEAVILATNDPSSGDFKVIADMDDLYNYPAIWRNGSSGGGGIYQVVEYNGSLYVAIVSGTYDTMSEDTRQFRSFAIVRGDYDETKGAIDDKDAWTWTPVVGDQENDGAKYTFGIDPERTASSACTLQVYGGYLYIGEYNDVNGSLNGILSYKEFATLAANLEDSINLYRMDIKENIEMVVGDATAMFPDGGISGWGSGYNTHMSQYTWMTNVYDGTMYLSLMDETSLTEPIAQFVNGDLLNMTAEEWESEINYLKVLTSLLTDNPVEEEDTAMLSSEQQAQIDKVEASEELIAQEDVAVASIAITDGLSELSEQLDDTYSDVFSDEYEDLLEKYNSVKDQLPENMQSVYDMLLDYATLENMKDLSTCLYYMKDSEAGFDLMAITQDDDGSVDITAVSTDGFGDRYNHGLRIFANTTDYMAIGTANPFYGTQIWRMSATPTEETPKAHTEHTFDKGVVTVKPTCTTPGVKTYTCTVCGYSYMVPIKATGHSYSKTKTKAATCTHNGKTTYTCKNCGDTYCKVSWAKGHCFDDGQVTKAATCTEDGVLTYTCVRCGLTKTEAIPSTGTHDWVLSETTADGGTKYVCSACGAVSITKPEHIHNYKNKKRAYTPSCVQATMSCDCGQCKETVKDTSYTGFGKACDGNSYYYEKGNVSKKTTVVKNQANKKWYYVKDGQVQKNTTSVVKRADNNTWWYVKNGVVQFNYTTVVKRADNNTWWYVKNGKVRFDVTGLVKRADNNTWWYVKNGKVQFGFNGLAKNSYGYWYVKNGKVQKDFTGTIKVNGKTYVVKKGLVQ